MHGNNECARTQYHRRFILGVYTSKLKGKLDKNEGLPCDYGTARRYQILLCGWSVSNRGFRKDVSWVRMPGCATRKYLFTVVVVQGMSRQSDNIPATWSVH